MNNHQNADDSSYVSASDSPSVYGNDTARRVFALTIAYDGTNYAGWQYQINATSVQQRIEEAAEIVLGTKSSIFGSGRTDSGVHAIGQVARLVTTNWRHSPYKLIPAMNRRLPRDIAVRDIREALTDFDPVRSSTSKRYRYTIRSAPCDCPMSRLYHWHHPRPLLVEAMQEAANFLVGCHDFVAFQSLGSPRLTTVRTVRELSIFKQENRDGFDLLIEIEADGFLYNMVRNIIGALIEVGTDRFGPRWILEVLNSTTRAVSSGVSSGVSGRGVAGITAPACGLCMLHVGYPPSLWINHQCE